MNRPPKPVDLHKQQVYPPNAKPKTGGAVTAIAGFRCANGAILCADSELHHGTLVKTQINKITTLGSTKTDVRAAITGAGDWDDVQRVIQYLQDNWQGVLAGKSLDLVVDEKVKDIYAQPHTTDWAMAIIAVIWRVGERVRVIKADDYRGVKQVPTFSCDGMGLVFSNYVANFFYKPHISLRQGLSLASYILYVADNCSPFCGGIGNIFMLTDDGGMDSELEWDMHARREFFERLTPVTRPIILEGPDEYVTREDFEDDIQHFVERLRTIRKQAELDTAERAKKYGYFE